MAKESNGILHLLLLSLLIIVSQFVDSSHGRKQAKGFWGSQMLKERGYNGEVDKSDFEAQVIDIEAYVCGQEGLKEKDKILRLPGQPQVKFSQYGGYVTVDKEAGRAFYYYFVEAQQKKDSLPLVLWLNGGPGCSSLIGAMQELGPFRVRSDGKSLYKFRYPWNYVANVLFLESPQGVGFSYSNKSSDYKGSGDKRTAEDNYVFLVNWLERFPEYKNRDFYITGESYGGHFVPELAHTILYHNAEANKTIINLKGIMIGNAAIDNEEDTRGMHDYWESHAIISHSARLAFDFCRFDTDFPNTSRECNETADEIYDDILENYINIYNIYAPTCLNPNLTSIPNTISDVIDPCNENYVNAYLNRRDVQEAMHANITKLKYNWTECSIVLKDWFDSPSTILPILQQLLNHRLRVWIYSGDVDARVPVTSTLYSLKKMNLTAKTPWHPWFVDRQVGGYRQVYKGGLTFATVRGAGHEVPSYQPARALSLFKHFLDGTPLPSIKQSSLGFI